jgi:hypothetical protein
VCTGGVHSHFYEFICSVEIILRGECVEMAQPGDRCDFTGTLIVVPDVGQLATPGARAELGSKGNRTGAQTSTADQGVQGLKALGVRDLSYKMAFLACAVSTQNPKVVHIRYTRERVRVCSLVAFNTHTSTLMHAIWRRR